MQPMLSLRREGAKRRDTSNGRIPISNLSAFAPLRETSPTQSRKESFSPRREGAKRTDRSNGQISVSSLSALASLRETSARQSQEESFALRREGAKRRNKSKHQTLFGHAIGDALNAVLDQVFAEVDKEPQSLIHQPQIGQDLFAVDRIERDDRFHLHDHEIIDDQVGAEAFVEPDSIPRDRNSYLSFHGVAVFAQFMRKQDFVYDFEDAWPEPGVQAVSSVNDLSRDLILFHTAKLVLLRPVCEAQNPSSVTSLRETSATQSQKESFSLRREGAKRTETSNGRISVSNLCALAPLGETFDPTRITDNRSQAGP